MKKNIFIISLLAGTVCLASCEDFLTQQNTTSANQETFFDSDKALQAATAPLYNFVWDNFNSKFYYGMGDGRANNLTGRWSTYIYPYTNFTETALSDGLEEAWGSFYSVIAQANYTIDNIQQFAGPAVTEDAKTQAYAEARFMRGLAYWYIGSLWGKAIIYEHTAALVGNSVVPPNRGVDAIEFAIRDLEWAATHLAKVAPAAGRVTCYSAYGLLSRIYLSMAGLTTDGQYNGTNIATDFDRGTRNAYYLDLSKKAATKVIKEGPYELLPDYGDLFSVAHTNNNKESVFQLQWSKGAPADVGWGATNQMPVFFSWSTMVGEQNWGNALYASYDLVREYTPVDKRRNPTIATVGAFYPDLNKANGGYTYNETESGYDNKCNIKKYVIGKIDDNGQSYQQSSGLNTYMMRLAEVYLILAEATLGNNASTTDATALEYFNKVRTRAGLPTLSVLTYENIRYERRIELAIEGQYWYDLLRRAYYKQQEVVNYLNHQDRNADYEWDETEPCQYAMTNEGTGVSTATAANLLLPISDVDRGRNPLLGGAPVAYEFGEREVSEQDLFN
ncbi:MAG: RagB/SusD family nutrient uptake outer membrane protein [Mediterranea sp.]|jgi:hypothetical protein|nr:RagB/SusD family nutrient uptake outer membrane protein [Mediterranea sp.]